MGRPQAIRLHEAGEVWQDFISDDAIHLRKSVIGNPQSWSSGFKRYAEHDAGILAVLRTRIDAYPTYYFALIERPVEHLEERGRFVAVPSLGGSGQDGTRTDDCGDMMLAVIPQISEQDQPIVLEGPVSVIRLMPLDGIDDSLIKSGQLWNDVLREFWERSTLKESQVAPLSRAGRGEVPDQVVKQRRKIVGEVGGVQTNTGWCFARNLSLIKMVGALAVEFGRGEAIRIRGEELAFLYVEVVQVQLRTLKPLSQRSHGGNVRFGAGGEGTERVDPANLAGS